MDPTIQAGFNNLTLTGSQRYQLQSFADHNVLERMLIQGGDPANYADLTASSHVPTSQPWVAPPWVGPQGGPPAQTPAKS